MDAQLLEKLRRLNKDNLLKDAILSKVTVQVMWEGIDNILAKGIVDVDLKTDLEKFMSERTKLIEAKVEDAYQRIQKGKIFKKTYTLDNPNVPIRSFSELEDKLQKIGTVNVKEFRVTEESFGILSGLMNDPEEALSVQGIPIFKIVETQSVVQ